MPAIADAMARSHSHDGESGDPAAGSGRRAAIEDALDALPAMSRAAVLLRHRYGYEYAEIATMLDTSVDDVGAPSSLAREPRSASTSKTTRPMTARHGEIR